MSFNDVIKYAYLDAISMAMSSYYSHKIYEEMENICKKLNISYVFLTFTPITIDFTCEIGIKVTANSGSKISPKLMNSISEEIPFELVSWDSEKMIFYLDNEKYFENRFINSDDYDFLESLITAYDITEVKL